MDNSGFESREGKNFYFLQNVRTNYGVTEAHDLRAQRSGLGADHSTPPCVEIKNDWSWTYTCTPLKCLHCVQGENFTSSV